MCVHDIHLCSHLFTLTQKTHSHPIHTCVRVVLARSFEESIHPTAYDRNETKRNESEQGFFVCGHMNPKWLLLVLLACVGIVAYFTGITSWLKLEYVKQHRAELLEMVDAHKIAAPVLYILGYCGTWRHICTTSTSAYICRTPHTQTRMHTHIHSTRTSTHKRT